MQVFGSKNISKSCRCQEPGGLRGICHIDHRVHWVEHLEVDHRVHGDCDTVLGEDLLRRDVEGDGSQVDCDDIIKAWNHKE